MGLSSLLYIPKKMRLFIFSSRSSTCCHSLCRISVTKFSYVASCCAVSRLLLFSLCWGIPMNISFPGNSLKKAPFGSGIWGSQVGMGLCTKDLMVASLCMHLFLFTAKDWQFWEKKCCKGDTLGDGTWPLQIKVLCAEIEDDLKSEWGWASVELAPDA